MLADEGRHDEALAAYREAVELDAGNSHAWFNMALVHKYNRAWEEAVRCGQRAAQLVADDYPTWWNLGIAATALGDWSLARKAWRRWESTSRMVKGRSSRWRWDWWLFVSDRGGAVGLTSVCNA